MGKGGQQTPEMESDGGVSCPCLSAPSVVSRLPCQVNGAICDEKICTKNDPIKHREGKLNRYNEMAKIQVR